MASARSERLLARPQHVGDNILPNFSLFVRLLFYAQYRSSVAINDVTNSLQGTHADLLSDVLHLRNAVRDMLSSEVRERLILGHPVAINLLASGGYEFAVGFLAIVALGAIVVPISVSVPVKEALYFANASQSIAILCASKQVPLAQELADRKNQAGDIFHAVNIKPFLRQRPIHPADIVISSDHLLSYLGTGLVIFTSGTSGPPKGVAKQRKFLDMGAQTVALWYNLQPDDVVLHILPVHHATGIGINFVPFLLAGATIEFHSSGFDPSEVWDRWRRGGLTFFSGVPTIYMRLMRYFQEDICQRPASEVKAYVDAARSFRLMVSGSAALPFSLQKKWIELLDGKRVLERYGSTEANIVFTVKPGDMQNPDGSVGKAFFGLDVKLSDGDEGEVLIKTPNIFSGYIHDQEATAKAFTEDGYFHSGDIARREGDYYFILGRASVDIIKSGGYKISALDIEREILDLPYIGEVMVVGVEDEEYGQRVAAAVSLQGVASLSLVKLRSDLRARLSNYKLPTLLRVVDALPKSSTGKVVKRTLQKELFPPVNHPDVERWNPTRAKM